MQNDSEENLRRTAEFIRSLKAVEKVSLLPYNAAGGAEYRSIGINYELEQVTPYSKERLKTFVEIFSRLDVRAELSG